MPTVDAVELLVVKDGKVASVVVEGEFAKGSVRVRNGSSYTVGGAERRLSSSSTSGTKPSCESVRFASRSYIQ